MRVRLARRRVGQPQLHACREACPQLHAVEMRTCSRLAHDGQPAPRRDLSARPCSSRLHAALESTEELRAEHEQLTQVAVRRRHTPAHVQRMLHTPACTSWCGALCSGACARAPRQRARAAPTLLLPHMSATLSSAREAKAAPSCRQSEQRSKHSHNGHAPICSGSRQTRAQRNECIHFLRTVRAAPRLAHAPAQKHAHAQTDCRSALWRRSSGALPAKRAECARARRGALRASGQHCAVERDSLVSLQ